AMPVSRVSLWIGRIISAVVVLFMAGGGVYTIANADAMAKQLSSHMGYPAQDVRIIAGTQVACAIIYAIPQTSVLGAILLTGYLGGATASHVRIGEPFYFPVVFGILVWLGLYLRDRRLRELVPTRR